MDDRDLIVAYLADKDYRCPHCQYNLRAITDAICPECGMELAFHPDAICLLREKKHRPIRASKGLHRAAVLGTVLAIPLYLVIALIGAPSGLGGLLAVSMRLAIVMGLIVHPLLAFLLVRKRAQFYRLTMAQAYYFALATWYWAVLPALFALNSMVWGSF